MDKFDVFKVPKFPLVVITEPDQTPKLEGVPPKLENKFMEVPLTKLASHNRIVPSEPASNKLSIVTVTVAELEGQIPVAGKV